MSNGSRRWTSTLIAFFYRRYQTTTLVAIHAYLIPIFIIENAYHHNPLKWLIPTDKNIIDQSGRPTFLTGLPYINQAILMDFGL